ncbi:MAG: hypothetical protein U5J99_07280 [Parvularculaceae bacterium]|nr:hypothetical protein [Parvularculaceae bacterium]
MTDFAFAPLTPTWVLIALGALAAIAAAIALWRNPASGILRALAMAAFVALLLNPQIREAERSPLDDIAVIIADRSGSQTLDGRDGATAQAEAALTEKFAALGGVDVVRIDAGDAEETRLGEALARAVGDNPRARLAGVFVITDGQSTDAPAIPRLKDAAPIHVLLTGRRDEADRKITLVKAPRYGIVREGAEISFRVDDLGPDGEAQPTRGDAIIILRVDGEEVLRQGVPIASEVAFIAPLDRPGQSIIELEVEEAGGELTQRNNIVVLPVTVIRDRLRVLLISGEPHPGERAWRNLLKSDPAIDLVHFTILRPIEKAQNDTALESELALIEFPQDELFIEKLDEFDLVIFDRFTDRGVLNAFHFDNLARYVEGGGAVLVASGPEFSGPYSIVNQRNFSFVLPAQPAGEAIVGAFRPRVSATGERHPVTAALPEKEFWGRWLRLTPAEVRAGQVLMTDDADRPLLILERVGQGRVGLLQSDHVWLWARGFDGGGPHAELLRRIAHWLMKEPDLEEERLSLREDAGALIIERRTIGEDAPPVRLVAPDGTESDVSLARERPGFHLARLPNAARGLYRARSDDLFAIGSVGLAAPPEFENVVSDRRTLAPLAAASGGGVFDLRRNGAVSIPDIRQVRANGATSGVAWAGLVERRAFETQSVRDRALAPPLVWLIGIAACLLGAWLVEGRGARLFGRA